jgi:hypothetical protein
MNGFDTLDEQDAIENAKASMASLLDYLDRTDFTRELIVGPIETGGGLECVAG